MQSHTQSALKHYVYTSISTVLVMY